MRPNILLSTLTLSGLLWVTSSNAQGVWEQRSSIPSQQGRWGAATFVINGIGYTVGGYNGTADISTTDAYDPTTDTWTSRAPLPSALRLASGFAIGGKGYVVCGLSSTSNHRNTVYEYDPATNTWTQRGNFPASARYGMASFVVNGVGYVACGNSGNATGPYNAQLWAYSPGSDSWTQRANMPGQTRFACSGFAVGDKGYVFGGRLSDQTFSNELFEYDPTSNSWTVRTPLAATPRSYPQTFASGDHGFVVAGSDLANQGLTDCWAYHQPSDTWIAVAAYPGSGFWGGSSFAIGSRLYSGFGRFNTTIPNEFYEFRSPFPNVGLADHEAPAALPLAPNPVGAGSIIVINIPENASLRGTELVLMDAGGKLVHRERFDSRGKVQWTLPLMPPGTYIATLVDQGRVLRQSPLVVLGGE